ncbi:GNAT family N-acetyltransferase [Ekhidna sp. To15]|uniref:GNAT family N-acetyltransferase n=1 Tax=Ekhidna sp. To15 TaxID=3395267 RepID=UPI003F522CB5
MDIRLLSEEDFDSLYKTFKVAFTNNEVSFQPSVEEFSYRLDKKFLMNGYISAGSYDGNEMTGFILHSSGIYQGIPTAYNGGTGVLPGFRNQKTAERIYEFLIPRIQQKFLARILLEVVETNKTAISLYEKIGFTFKRRFKCYKMASALESKADERVGIGTMEEVNFDFVDFEPSFIDSSEHLKRGAETVIVAKEKDIISGYLIFQPHLGRISQLAVAGAHRNEGIGEALLRKAQSLTKKSLTIMNIPEDELGFDSFLTRCGFKNEVNQYEMELII